MTKEEKELVIKDLSARLPYGVKLKIRQWKTLVELTIIKHSVLSGNYIINENYRLDDIKPYLRPMSSMTKEEEKILEDFGVTISPFSGLIRVPFNEITFPFITMQKVISYLYSIHIDINGLILKGLAIEAPEGMYN